MPGAFIEKDLAAIFSEGDFAVRAKVFAPGNTVAFDIVRGIFENATVETDIEDGRIFSAQEAIFVCPTSSPIRSDWRLDIDGQSYIARIPEHDGTGVTTWRLDKVRP